MVVCIIEKIKEIALKNASLFSSVTGLKTYWLDQEENDSASGRIPCPFCSHCVNAGLSASHCETRLIVTADHMPVSETGCIYFCPSGLCRAVVPVFNEKHQLGAIVSEAIFCSDSAEDDFTWIGDRITKESYFHDALISSFSVWPYAKFSRAARLLTQIIHPEPRDSLRETYAKQLKEAVSEEKISTVKHILDCALDNIVAENGDDIIKIKSACIQFIFMLAEISDESVTGEMPKWTSSYSLSLADANSIGQLKSCLNAAGEILIQCMFQSAVLKRNLQIQKATDMIESQFQTRLSQNAVAKAVYLTPSYFSKVFKETVGCNFSQYLNQIRVEKAKELLANPLIDLDDDETNDGLLNQDYEDYYEHQEEWLDEEDEEDKAMHFTANRYLYDNKVVSIIDDGDKGCWVQTETGVVHIEMKPVSTREKAEMLLDEFRSGVIGKITLE